MVVLGRRKLDCEGLYPSRKVCTPQEKVVEDHNNIPAFSMFSGKVRISEYARTVHTPLAH